MSRTKNFLYNMSWKLGSTAVTAVMNFLNRYIFMHWMGAEYLGVSGLFSSVLGVLSFADLGLAGAFSFCFYQAIAKGDKGHCSVLITTLEKLLNIAALCIFAIGLLLVPVLPMLVTGSSKVDMFHLRLYYVLFLLDMVNGYLFMARTCYVTAHQKEFLTMPITIGFGTAKVLVGIICILATRNYILYLISGIVVGLLQRLTLNHSICRRFPEAKIKKGGTLSIQEKTSIKRNIKAAVISKMAGISVQQTDNILISAGVGIVITGYVSNYISIKAIVLGVLSNISTCLTPSMGNAMVTETKERQLEIFYQYVASNMFLVGMSCTLLTVLSTPFIKLMFEAQAVLPFDVVAMMNFATLFMYSTYALNILPSAAGRHDIGVSTIWIEGVGNLVFSLIAMHYLGLLGVYVGTVLSELIVYIIKPFIVMKKLYACSPSLYFKITAKGIISVVMLCGLMQKIGELIFFRWDGWFSFFVYALLSGIFSIAGYSLIHCKDVWYKKVILLGIQLAKSGLASRKQYP